MSITHCNETRTTVGRRSRAFVVMLAGLAAVSLLTGCIGTDQSSALSALRADRTANRVRTISLDAAARSQAQSHAAGMAAGYALYHSPLNLARGECAMGENVGFGASVGQVERAFMASPPHRRNILNGSFDHVGIGVLRSHGKVWVVQLFIDYC